MKHFPDLADALSQLLDRIDSSLRAGGYSGEAIRMYLAGGMAVNYYCGSRYTQDVDAIFSRRIHLPELIVDYQLSSGAPAWLTLDQNYNPTLGLLHDHYEKDAIEWTGIGNEKRRIHLLVLSPLDLATTKISRYSPQDVEDITALASAGLFTAEALRQRAQEALINYIGDLRTINTSIDLICRRMAELRSK